MAFLVLLETLSPVERAVFMLREVFGYGYPDVARITGKTEVNCRQIFARARQRIAAGGPVRDSAPPPARRAEGEQLARRFFEAAAQLVLQECFPGYPSRSYFKLPPHFRYLAMTSGGGVAAQMGVEFRVIRVGDSVVRTFGVVDLCVTQSERSRGLAGRLLADVTEFARSCGMAFVVLFADDDRLYARNGWARVTNRCSWVRIDDHRTLGIASRADPGAMMVKPVGEQAWPQDDVDLLGHVF
jgi:GNAT superfamily N-acetyltransferase